MTGPGQDSRESLALLIGETRTGVIRSEVTGLESLSCSDGLDPDDVSLRCSARVAPGQLGGIDRDNSNPADTFVALTYAHRVLWAGPVWGRRYSARTGVLDLAASGLMSVFDRRWCAADPTAPPLSTSADIALSGLSLRAIAARLVQYGTRPMTAGAEDGRLPVNVGALADETGTAQRNYFGYDLASVGERLRQLSDVANGPDMHFAPRWPAGGVRDRIEWVFRAGSPALGQVGAPWVWESGNNVRDVSTDEDGGAMASLVMVPGEGTDRDKIIGTARRTTLQAAGWPGLFQVSRDHTSTRTQSTLDGYAAEYARARHVTAESWTVTVDAFTAPALGDWLVGDDCRVLVPDDPWLTGNTYVRRIVGWTYDGGDAVTLTLTPTPGQVG